MAYKDKSKQRDAVRAGVTKIRAERHAWAYAKLGGHCADCGSVENLQFDHIDRATKNDDIGHLWTAEWTVFVAEVKKCCLRCKFCHQKKSIRCGDVSVAVHGSITMYDKGCRCLDCCAARHAKYLKLKCAVAPEM